MSKIIKLLLINIGLCLFLLITYFISGFLSGYGANTSYAAAAWRLYIGFIIVHLIINFLLLKRFKILDSLSIVFRYIEVLILYGIAALLIG